MNQVIIFNRVKLIKFYTDIRSGRSGISRTGLALLCHQNLHSIWRLIDSLKEGKIPPHFLLSRSVNIEKCLYHFNNEIYCDDRLSIAILFYYGLNNPELNSLLTLILNRGFNEWIAEITGWKRMYRRFEENPVNSSYQERMEKAYELVRDKAFLESCLNQ